LFEKKPKIDNNRRMDKYKGLILDKFQKQAIEEINRGNSIIISAPTGAGKTLIAEYAIEKAISRNKGIIYTAPVKALSNQKYRDFQKLYKDKAGILTGDVSINSEAEVLIMTTEIFRNLILTEPERLSKKEWVIFDEIHYLDDFERGTVWEESLMLMPRHLKILALSATVPNVDKISGWLNDIHHIPIQVIKENIRPVPLKFFFQSSNRIFTKLEDLEESIIETNKIRKIGKIRSKDAPLPKPNRIQTLFEHLKEKEALPCIYFTFSRARTEILAQELAKFDFLNKDEKEKITGLYKKLISKFDLYNNPTAGYLTELVKKGIAFHHAGLLPTLKEVIEQLFTSRLLKVIFTTETFALGINMPARTVVFDTLRKFYGRYHRNLKTRDLYQMAGRAGRRGIDKQGFVFLRINPASISINELKDTLYGQPEKITSQLRSNYATILNLYKDLDENIYDIYPLSFHSYQSDRYGKDKALSLIKSKLSLLKKLNYITGGGNLSNKGKLASRIYSYELQVGEMYEKNFLQRLGEKELAVVISSLIYQPRKNQRRARLNKKERDLAYTLTNITKAIHKEEKKFRIYPQAKRFYFNLNQPLLLWLDGIKFSKLSKFTNIDEGEIVRCFRMDIQMLRELILFEEFEEEFKQKAKRIIRRLNRDVVDAEKQLRQEI